MGEETFFDKNGNTIEKGDFLKLYCDSYYLDKDQYVPGLSRCSRSVENEIDNLLKRGIDSGKQGVQDVVHILAWKIGKIAHKKSESEKEFKYYDYWKNAEKYGVMLYGKPFKLGIIAKYIVDHMEDLTIEERNDLRAQNVLNKMSADLKREGVTGIGPVYLLTLLYFLSKGIYPIYDRFAMMAVDAIIAGAKPGDAVEYHTLPDKSSKKFNTIMQDHMAPYIHKLDRVFGGKYQNSRDIDRALWTYGHLFVAAKKSAVKS